MSDKPTALYRLYDANERLLYVGISLNVAQRMGGHSLDKEWWPDVARIDVENHPSGRAARDAERQAIQREQPIHNIALADYRPKPPPLVWHGPPRPAMEAPAPPPALSHDALARIAKILANASVRIQKERAQMSRTVDLR